MEVSRDDSQPCVLQVAAQAIALPPQGSGPRSHRQHAVGSAVLPLAISCPLLTSADVNQNDR